MQPKHETKTLHCSPRDPVPPPVSGAECVGAIAVAEQIDPFRWSIDVWHLGGYGSQTYVHEEVLRGLIRPTYTHATDVERPEPTPRFVVYQSANGGYWIGSTHDGGWYGVGSTLLVARALAAVGAPPEVVSEVVASVAGTSVADEITAMLCAIYEGHREGGTVASALRTRALGA